MKRSEDWALRGNNTDIGNTLLHSIKQTCNFALSFWWKNYMNVNWVENEVISLFFPPPFFLGGGGREAGGMKSLKLQSFIGWNLKKT